MKTRVTLLAIFAATALGCGKAMHTRVIPAVGSSSNASESPVIPVVIAGPMADLATKGSIDIQGSCHSGVNVEFFGDIQPAAAAACVAGQFAKTVALTAPDGVKSVGVRQNHASTVKSASRSFVLDTLAPVVAITAPAANSSQGASATLSGTCESGLAVSISGGIDAAMNATCVNGAFSTPVNFAAPNGNKTVTVAQTDAAGNSGSSSRVFVRNAAGPNLVLNSPAANTAARTGVTLAGTCEGTLPVQIAGSGVSMSAATACANNAFSAAITFSNGDGVKLVSLTQANAAGASTTISRNFIRDNIGPALTIAAPAAGTSAESGVTLTGACETGLSIAISGSLSANVSVACANSSYSAALTFTVPDGTKSVTVSQVDGAGNSTSVTRSFTKFTPLTSGPTLYTAKCAGCHGPLNTSQKLGASVARIQAALSSVPAMTNLASQLSASDIAAISNALTSAAPPPPPPPTPTPAPPAGPCVDPMPERRVWSLSRVEYDNTVRAVLNNTSDLAQAGFPVEDRANGFTNNAQAQSVSSSMVSMMMTAAETIASQSLAGQLTFISGTLGCTIAATLPAGQDACVVNYIRNRGAAFFRRPLNATEVNELYATYVVGFNNPIDNVTPVNSGIQTLIATMLQMPQFFYRTELGAEGSTANPVQLTQYEIAASIAFMATGSPPDATLTAAAAAGTLSTAAAISAQYQRLMASTAGRAQMQRFVLQWLGADQIGTLGMAGTPVTPALAGNMLSEAQSFVNEAVFNGTGTVRELLTGNYTFVNTALATHYGLSTTGTTANTMTKVTLPSTSSRGGLLSQGAFIVSNSKAGVPLLHRGLAVRNKILCETLPSVAELGLPGFVPPPFTPPPAGVTTKESLKSSIVGVCYTCHQYFMPIGYSMEKFDSFGRFQSTQNGGVVDPSGDIVNSTVIDYVTGKISAPTSFTTTAFQDFHDMAAKLADHPRTNSCFSNKVVTYVSGRKNVGQNECAIEKTMKPAAGSSAATIQQQFLNYTQTPNFIMRSR